MTNIRITSFCLELVDQRKQFDRTPLTPGERRQKYMLFDLFVYVFYLPLYFTGPIMTFDQFDKQVIYTVQTFSFCRVISIPC